MTDMHAHDFYSKIFLSRWFGEMHIKTGNIRIANAGTSLRFLFYRFDTCVTRA
jgi:hypothetical protein